jgi:hypothetical protein
MYNECRHIFTSGKKCQSPALTDENFCYFHNNRRKRPSPKDQPYEPYIAPQDTAHQLTPLDDDAAIQLALSDVVLALAANRIDSRRARILIYGLQVASQNIRHRRVPQAREASLGMQDVAVIVREIHEHEDGTLIAPPKQTPDPEEIREKRRPSLGEILLREAEAMKAEREAEREAQKAAEANQPVSITLPQLQAAAETWELNSPSNPRKIERPSCHRRRKHNTCRRNPVWQQPLDHPLQLHNGSSRNLQEEGVAARHMMAFLHFGQLFHELEEGMIPRPITGHANDRQNRQPQRLAVNLNRVSPNGPGILHPPQPLCGRRS